MKTMCIPFQLMAHIEENSLVIVYQKVNLHTKSVNLKKTWCENEHFYGYASQINHVIQNTSNGSKSAVAPFTNMD